MIGIRSQTPVEFIYAWICELKGEGHGSFLIERKKRE